MSPAIKCIAPVIGDTIEVDTIALVPSRGEKFGVFKVLLGVKLLYTRAGAEGDC